MTLSDLIQTVIVAAIVLFSAWQVLGRFVPKKAAKPSTACGSGTGSTCDTCGACKTIHFDIDTREGAGKAR